MKMKTKLFAFLAVALMMALPLAVFIPSADADSDTNDNIDRIDDIADLQPIDLPEGFEDGLDGDAMLLGDSRATTIPVTLTVDESQGYFEQVVGDITDVACSTNNTLFLTSDGKLYGMGQNSSYALGIGVVTAVTTPMQIHSDLGIITKMFIYGGTAFVITSDGKLYGWGGNTTGQVGNGTTYNVRTPTQIGSDLGTIADVIQNDSVSYFLTSDGELYGTGRNNHGQMGDGTKTNVSTPIQIGSDLGTITKAVCSDSTLLFITSDGKLYGTGLNNYYQISSVSTDDVVTPTQIGSDLGTISDVVCGQNTTIFITSDGKLYGVGNSGSKQIGGSNATTPRQIGSDLGTIVYVEYDGSSNYFITSDGKLYGMGYNNNGQIGNGSTSNVSTPFQIGSDLGSIVNVQSSSSLGATLFLTDDGKLYGMGSNNHYQQGDGTTVDVLTPKQIGSDLGTITKTYNSMYMSFVISSDSKLYGWGYNNNYQQGDGTTDSVTTPKQIVTPIISGSTITIQVPEGTQVTTSGDTITFGNETYRFVSTGSDRFSGWDAPETITEEITINVELTPPEPVENKLVKLIPLIVIIALTVMAAIALMSFTGNGIDLIKLLIGLTVCVLFVAMAMIPAVGGF